MNEQTSFGEILRQQFGVPAEVIDRALQRQAEDGRRLDAILLEDGEVDKSVLRAALARQLDLPWFETLPEPKGTEDLLGRLSMGYLRENRVFPLERAGGRLLLAMANPNEGAPVNDLVALTGDQVEICLAPDEEILQAINRAYERHDNETQALGPDIGGDESPELEPADLLDTSDEAPVIRFVNGLLTKACRERASDIHIEPFETELVVRFRIDGILYEILRPPRRAHAAIVSRLKIMAGLDIAEKRLPQDGRFRVRIAGRDVDVRVSSLPTAFGERLVLRLLEKTSGVLSLADLGLNRELMLQVDRLIHQPHGIFLVTGPTGSGKTTTLYAALTRLNSQEKNIITVEDPIEYQLAGVGQIQVNPKIDLTFAAGLRSILRQDPDIIMVGEIRDVETAEIAVQAALTGHMVFSTLHTNDAAGALTRLVEMGIEPFLAASSIVAVMAQRLVRRLCPRCRQPFTPDDELLRSLGAGELPADAVFYRPAGCDDCLQIGYHGRTGIYELMPMDDTLRELLMQGKDANSIAAAALRRGMRSLRNDGLRKALAGETSIEEVLRVTSEEN
ncbi:type II secretion system protein E (GspE) [Geothermobacter ehrlichii]|uniref:protein-secreting ATPase n=1 Tax=Geothermobacter ehrlichii TaxID=213224 RepID=A0A5D3WGJ2_9BACT|nr:type II secretion system ATPase GspE [Geothermobacter ehrlichii]TYO97564.1 type II secretion system protein E (GspE) [Geothermobacter ehrlichii]